MPSIENVCKLYETDANGLKFKVDYKISIYFRFFGNVRHRPIHVSRTKRTLRCASRVGILLETLWRYAIGR